MLLRVFPAFGVGVRLVRIEDEKNGERFRETFGRVVLRGPLDFNSLTKLPKTRGFLSFPT